jgi:hypothetical protein
MAADGMRAAARRDAAPNTSAPHEASSTSGRQVRELQAVLGTPYAEQDAATEARWARVTPRWARQKAGLAFMT